MRLSEALPQRRRQLLRPLHPEIRLHAVELRGAGEAPFDEGEGAAGVAGGLGVDPGVPHQEQALEGDAEAVGEDAQARGIGLAGGQAVAAQDLAEEAGEAQAVEDLAGERLPLVAQERQGIAPGELRRASPRCPDRLASSSRQTSS